MEIVDTEADDVYDDIELERDRLRETRICEDGLRLSLARSWSRSCCFFLSSSFATPSL